MLEIQQKRKIFMKNYIHIITASPLFYGIDKTETASALSCLGAKIKSYSKNEIIINSADKVDFIAILLDGSAEISHIDCYGNRNILSAVAPGELFAETFAAAGIENAPVCVTASKDCTCLFLDYSRIVSPCCNACSFHGKLIGNLLKITAKKNMVLTKKIEIISKRTTREKLLTYLSLEAENQRKNEFRIPFDRQGLADYLGVERSALSAVIGSLRDEGIIQSKKNLFKINEPSL